MWLARIAHGLFARGNAVLGARCILLVELAVARAVVVFGSHARLLLAVRQAGLRGGGYEGCMYTRVSTCSAAATVVGKPSRRGDRCARCGCG